MGKIVLVTGGTRSGKSQFTEEQLWEKERVCYIATGISSGKDSEWQERVRLHRERRPAAWTTHEQFADLGSWLKEQTFDYYLLDCATMLTTNLLFQLVETYFPEKIALEDDNFLSKEEQAFINQQIHAQWQDIIGAKRLTDGQLYIVTNEIGLGIVPDTKLGRYFRDLLGQVNQFLAKEASEVYLVICGLAQRLK
ncbi:TPA: bifunctional adenosylcobinamide kinase/adenosylcobinamide-phosphate guanylyltransferase [Streptococcus suis]|nr:bifunctional adenosylcobinamide kinase/adenosylcobinamide-phosphate guanylyltransferase [Streptococcus suis]HEM4054858.1 bifunctional adenosylcobinamide kinase/adenosylcobinamide-phosphate guanylyltransferase [Streptococcus suis]